MRRTMIANVIKAASVFPIATTTEERRAVRGAASEYVQHVTQIPRARRRGARTGGHGRGGRDDPRNRVGHRLA